MQNESLLAQINEPNDIKKIDKTEYKRLAKEIRSFLVKKVSKSGGHLASNLGAVELTMALHLFLDLPKDKLIWDVGHQSYTHKLLTGRRSGFDNLRQFNGMSGFPKHAESDCDAFDTGHSSTSISAADGIVKARDLKNEDYKVVAVIGDGALSGGMAYEALNNAGRFKSNMIIILNDNNMSISENVGGMAHYLGKLRTNTKYTGFKIELENMLNQIPVVGEQTVKKLKRSKDSIKQLFVPGMFFENMGLTYIGPIDGHNIDNMLTALEAAAKSRNPVIIHVITKKGKSYIPAEDDPSSFHSVEPFNCSTGVNITSKKAKSYTDIFSDTIIRIAENDKSIIAISAAMADGTGLSMFRDQFPRRFFDVGIAEEHAVTFAAGMASAGMHPVVAIYSTFLQRAYDQILHDVCISGLPVTFMVDRAGIVGNDGETHQGIFDLSYLSHIPGLIVMAPKNGTELSAMTMFACSYDGPAAIRYPRGQAYNGLCEHNEPISIGRCEIIEKKKDHSSKLSILLLAVGSMVAVGNEVKELLEEDEYGVTLVNARFVNPIDKESILSLSKEHDVVVTMEENVKRGGFGECVAELLMEGTLSCKYFINVSLPDSFLTHGKADVLRQYTGLDAISIKERIYLHINQKSS